MPISVQFNCSMQNEIAERALNNYVDILKRAFDEYRNLWQNFVQLQQNHEQCNVHPSSKLTNNDKLCTKAKDESDTKTNAQESNVSYLELDSLYRFSQDTDNLLKSPIFSRPHSRPRNNSAAKFIPFDNVDSLHNNTILDKKAVVNISPNTNKLSSNYQQKLEISTTHHVETTFLENGKKLKQTRLVFHADENRKKEISSYNVDKLKSLGTVQNAEHNPIDDNISVTNALVTMKYNIVNTDETLSEDIIEVSPTQIKNQYKNKKRLKPSRNICTKPMVNTGTITKMDKNKLLTKVFSTVDPLKGKIDTDNPPLIHFAQESNNKTYENDTLYSPSKKVVNRNDRHYTNRGDTENTPPAKKILIENCNILLKKESDISGNLDTLCKSDKAQMNGWDCWECKKYYETLALSKGELQKRKNYCSRHRQKYERPNTPEGFWDPEFPETLSSTFQ